MSETPQTQEVPLTKSQKNHLANIERNKEKKRRSVARRESIQERDEKLAEVNEKFLPAIARLKERHRTEMKKIWDAWKEVRNKAE